MMRFARLMKLLQGQIKYFVFACTHTSKKAIFSKVR